MVGGRTHLRQTARNTRAASASSASASTFKPCSREDESAVTTVARSLNMTVRDARQRLEHERSSRLTQLSAIEDDAALADEELSKAQSAAIRRVLAEVRAAEDRLIDGSYGTCQDCGTLIPVERLEILPYVRCCVSCQQRAT